MPTTKQRHEVKLLSVRMPEGEMRHLKATAAQRGLSVQEAVHQALKSWTLAAHNLRMEPLDALQGSLGDADLKSLRREERQAELVKDTRRS